MLGSKPCSTPVIADVKMSKHDGLLLDDPSEYRSLVGALQYITWTRPEITYSVNQVCQHMQAPTNLHLIATKRILRYLKFTLDYGIVLKKGRLDVSAFLDADWNGNPDDRRSTSGFCIFSGSNHVTWKSKKQATH